MAEDPLHLVCVEPRFPGRLGGVADWLVRKRGYRCRFFCHSAASAEHWPASVGRGLEVIGYNVGGVARDGSVDWRRIVERGLCYSYGAWEVIEGRRPRPVDAVLGRSAGLGSTLFATVGLPRAPVVQMFDHFHRGGADDPAGELGPDAPPAHRHWRKAANAVDLLDLENGVVPWTPTAYQRDLYPRAYRDDFLVLHDGVDARELARPAAGPMPAIGGRSIPAGVKLVAFVASGLDRTRGFDRFARLVAGLGRERSDFVAVALGDPIVGRMVEVTHFGRDYRAVALAGTPLPDPDRLWCPGFVPPNLVAEVLKRADLVVAPSRPYPASRSTVEAMAAGRTILATDGAPAAELIRDGVDGFLIDGDDPDAWLARAREVLDDPEAHRATLGRSAAAVARERFDRDATLPRLAGLLGDLAGVDR